MACCFEKVSKSYQRGNVMIPALRAVSGRVNMGEMVAIVGPSGCGKSTLLRLAAGLETPDSGTITWDGPTDPRVAMVFQDGALFPWLTVAENIRLALSAQALSEDEKQERVMTSLGQMQLADCAKSYPYQLSGGMRQRVGIARAWVTAPQLLLMDEPFSALDAQTARLLEEEWKRLRGEFQAATLYVTHKISEATQLADRIWVLSHRPGELIASYAIDVPLLERRDRRHEGTLRAIEEAIWEDIRREVDRGLRGVS